MPRAIQAKQANTAAAATTGAANAEGTSQAFARADHGHAVDDLAIAGQAQGDVLFFDGSNWLRLAPGVSGQHLQTQGVAADPTWATPAAAGTQEQESVTTETITGTDTALADPLDNTPVSNASVKLYLNGLLQIQGAGEDYTVAGTVITWLAATGTAVDMATTDDLVAVYES